MFNIIFLFRREKQDSGRIGGLEGGEEHPDGGARSSLLHKTGATQRSRLSKMSSKCYFKELEEKARLQRELEELRGGPKGSNVRLILFIHDKH